MNPEDKVITFTHGVGSIKGDKTNAEFYFGDLTDEVLRDIARNESASRPWRKAATKLLIERKSRFANHPDFYELAREIKEEWDAESEVTSLVESAIEKPLE